MKVAIGAVAGTIGGPATYAAELVRALVAGFPDDSFTVLTDDPSPFRGVCEAVHVPMRSAWEQPLWDHLRVPRVLARRDFDLYHGTKGVLPRRGSTPSVVTVHDLASHVMPSTFAFAQRLHLRMETPWAVSRARAVLVPSASTRDDVERFFPRARGKVCVTPEAPSRSLAPASADEVAAWRARHGIEGPACGYLGTIQPRKNLGLLVRSFLRAAGSNDWRLVIAGRLRPGQDTSFLGDDRRVVYVGALPDEEIPAFLGSLRCMASPSLYEGFGLTFVESMACGCPVVALRNSSVPEVLGNAGVLLDDESEEGLARAIARMMTDDAAVADLSRRGLARAARFSWAVTARLTMEAYRMALGQGRRGRG